MMMSFSDGSTGCILQVVEGQELRMGRMYRLCVDVPLGSGFRGVEELVD